MTEEKGGRTGYDDRRAGEEGVQRERNQRCPSGGKGIIIADTKFEFGLDANGNMVIGDEMLTPDSSRFWPADGYEAGHGQPSFDKQFARDWLKANPDNNWTLPQEIVDKTIEKYLQGYEMLTGEKLA